MNQVVEQERRDRKRAYKVAWQRRQRHEFSASHGYSTAANSATGGNRETVLRRDGFRCVQCGMTDHEHKGRWGRPITVDHKSKDRSDNSLSNLQTLCLVCHGKKDLIPRLRASKAAAHKAEILRLRSGGMSYEGIARSTGLSISVVWSWIKKWQGEVA